MPRTSHPTAVTLGLDPASGRKRVSHLVRRVLTAPGRLRVAAAYVTGDVEASLGLRASHLRDLTLLCEPFSGNCDPDLLNQLTDAGADVRAVPHLHAKEFASESSVVIGSANVSGAALVGERARTIEAAVAVEERSHVWEVHRWFDALADDAERWKDIRSDPAVMEPIRQAWARKQAHRGRRGDGTPRVPLLAALRRTAPFDWDGIVFSLVEVDEKGRSRQAAAAARSAGHSPAADWDYEWLDDATPADEAHVQMHATRTDSTYVVTLYVELDDDERLAKIVGVEETPWQLVGSGRRDGTLYVAYKPASLPLSLGRMAQKAAIAELNKGLARRPSLARRLDLRRFVLPATLAKLLA